jgi:ankyrin repeat protein
MDEVEAMFDACFEDRADEVADAIRNTPAVIHARRIGGRTPLHQAAFGGAERVVALLVANGADVNATTDYGWVPLHYAAAPESPAVAELLVRHGAKVDVANGDGSTPLHHAADFGKDAVVHLLLSHGANPNALDSDGHTPLNYVELDSEIARMLRSRGAQAGDPITVKGS